LKGFSTQLVVDAQIMSHTPHIRGYGELIRRRGVFDDGTDVAHGAERTQAVVQRASAGLPYTPGRVQAAQGE
jgi:hypothetical protein